MFCAKHKTIDHHYNLSLLASRVFLNNPIEMINISPTATLPT